MRTIPIKHQIKIFIGIMAFLCVIIGIFVVWPSLQRIKNMQEEIHRTQVYLEKQYQSGQNRRESLRRLNEIKEETKKFQNSTVDIGDELRVITTLEKLAGDKIEQDLTVSVPGEKKIKKPADQSENLQKLIGDYYTFSAISKGTFLDLTDYFYQLEQLPYYTIVNQLNWSRQQTDGSTTVLRFQTNIYAKEKKE